MALGRNLGVSYNTALLLKHTIMGVDQPYALLAQQTSISWQGGDQAAVGNDQFQRLYAVGKSGVVEVAGLSRMGDDTTTTGWNWPWPAFPGTG